MTTTEKTFPLDPAFPRDTRLYRIKRDLCGGAFGSAGTPIDSPDLATAIQRVLAEWNSHCEYINGDLPAEMALVHRHDLQIRFADHACTKLEFYDTTAVPPDEQFTTIYPIQEANANALRSGR